MDGLPTDLCLKIFCCLDPQSLASAQIVCRKWRDLGSNKVLWFSLFKERWGVDRATFYAPDNSKSWKDVYIVQDRCERVGVGLKIIREGGDYFLVHQGEIQRHLGSRRNQPQAFGPFGWGNGYGGAEFKDVDEPCSSVLDQILFFIGDLEAASSHSKRSRLL